MPKLHQLFVDAGGGDQRSKVIAGAIDASIILSGQAEIHLVGPERLIRQVATRQGLPLDQVVMHGCSLIVPMDAEVDLRIVRQPSTVHVAADLAGSYGGGVVSCGNTAAMCAIATIVAGRIPDTRRPGLAALLPTRNGDKTILMDAGATVDCKTEDLLGFAKMGKVYAEIALGVKKPRIGLLSNGSESRKGNDLTKSTHAALVELHDAGEFQFVGNIEGTGLFSGAADVIVTDGFAGNVALKVAEGASKFLGTVQRDELTRHYWSMVLARLLRPRFRAVRARLDPREHNGAAMLGCNIPFVKGHGSSDRLAACRAVLFLYRLMEGGLIKRIKASL